MSVGGRPKIKKLGLALVPVENPVGSGLEVPIHVVDVFPCPLGEVECRLALEPELGDELVQQVLSLGFQCDFSSAHFFLLSVCTSL